MSFSGFTLADIAERLGCEYKGEGSHPITGLAALDKATSDQLSFLDNPVYRKQLSLTRAAAVILKPEFAAESPVPVILSANPYSSYAKVTRFFDKQALPEPGIHPTAIIGQNCVIPSSASIGPYTVIGDNVVCGEYFSAGAHCVIHRNCQIGAYSRIDDRVILQEDTQLGAEVRIHSGTVIGADGFGFAPDRGQWVKVHHLGKVVIGDRVDIGANTTIDRGSLNDTVIEEDVIIDNQVQIAHNVRIGKGTAIAGCTGIAGSTQIGRYCLIGGGVSINGHIQLVDKVHLIGASVVYRSIEKPGVYMSTNFAQPMRDSLECFSIYQKLPQLAKQFQKLSTPASGNWLTRLFKQLYGKK